MRAPHQEVGTRPGRTRFIATRRRASTSKRSGGVVPPPSARSRSIVGRRRTRGRKRGVSSHLRWIACPAYKVSQPGDHGRPASRCGTTGIRLAPAAPGRGRRRRAAHPARPAVPAEPRTSRGKVARIRAGDCAPGLVDVGHLPSRHEDLWKMGQRLVVGERANSAARPGVMMARDGRRVGSMWWFRGTRRDPHRPVGRPGHHGRAPTRSLRLEACRTPIDPGTRPAQGRVRIDSPSSGPPLGVLPWEPCPPGSWP